MRNFEWMKSYNSPFKPPTPKFYIGKIAIGTPYFFPRITRKSKTKPGYMEFIPKRIGFDFVSLGWKTKWEPDDYRFEWSPMWSFVFFKWQIAVTFIAPEIYQYWECWLNYYYKTDKTKTTSERLEQAKKQFPCVYTIHSSKGNEETVYYWDLILRNKYTKLK